MRRGEPRQVFVRKAALALARKRQREKLLNRLRQFRGRLPADFKFDRDEANAR